MPKNSGGMKSKMRSKSTRRPLRDVSSAKTAVKSAKNLKKTSGEDSGQTGDDSLDRLLLVHSDLSSLLRQIDELVVQALQLTSNNGRKEIKQFADVLSSMQTSLKPWFLRFEKALSSQSTVPETKPEQSVGRTAVFVPKENTNAVAESPEQTKWESLVSPSPLVSWRAECNTEGGRQLFLLTPLPQSKAFSSKYKASSTIPPFEKILSEDVPEDLSAKPATAANNVSDIEVSKAVGNLEINCASPANLSKMNCSMFVMATPCLKMSPPKSCILLEPVSEFSRKKDRAVHKSTPFPAGAQYSTESTDSESSSSQSSDDLTVKYPELFGIKLNNVGNRTAAEDSPNWMVSPPKTCVIMEPSNEKLATEKFLLSRTAAICNQQDNLSLMKGDGYQHGERIIAPKTSHQVTSCTFDLDENSTPMVKGLMSSYKKGKHPGENTLKKELWTKFEAASTHGIRFTGSILQKTAQKGFLDKLEEASDA